MNLKILQCALLLACFAQGSEVTRAESIRSVTLSDLFSGADKVALVKVVSGDSEHYKTAVYKAVIEQGFKGGKSGDTIFFGPFVGYGVGVEYLVFLKKGPSEDPSSPNSPAYGRIESLDRIMYAGYSILPVGYECVFGDVLDNCDHSVQLNPDQIILPPAIETYPKGEATALTNYRKWVRRSTFLEELKRIASQSKSHTREPCQRQGSLKPRRKCGKDYCATGSIETNRPC
jgi:hypothetical protein